MPWRVTWTACVFCHIAETWIILKLGERFYFKDHFFVELKSLYRAIIIGITAMLSRGTFYRRVHATPSLIWGLKSKFSNTSLSPTSERHIHRQLNNSSSSCPGPILLGKESILGHLEEPHRPVLWTSYIQQTTHFPRHLHRLLVLLGHEASENDIDDLWHQSKAFHYIK